MRVSSSYQTAHAAIISTANGWEIRMILTRRIYFDVQDQVGDPRLPSTVDPSAPQYKRDCRRKTIYFRSQPAMRLIADAKCDVRVRPGWVFGDTFVAIVRLRPEDCGSWSSSRARTRSTMAASPASGSSSSRKRSSTQATACSSTRRTITTYYRSTLSSHRR